MGKVDLDLWLNIGSLHSITYAKQFFRHLNKFRDNVNLKVLMQVSDSNSYSISSEEIDQYCILNGRYCLDKKSYGKIKFRETDE
jgi:hypothetical protein